MALGAVHARVRQAGKVLLQGDVRVINQFHTSLRNVRKDSTGTMLYTPSIRCDCPDVMGTAPALVASSVLQFERWQK